MSEEKKAYTLYDMYEDNLMELDFTSGESKLLHEIVERCVLKTIDFGHAIETIMGIEYQEEEVPDLINPTAGATKVRYTMKSIFGSTTSHDREDVVQGQFGSIFKNTFTLLTFDLDKPKSVPFNYKGKDYVLEIQPEKYMGKPVKGMSSREIVVGAGDRFGVREKGLSTDENEGENIPHKVYEFGILLGYMASLTGPELRTFIYNKLRHKIDSQYFLKILYACYEACRIYLFYMSNVGDSYSMWFGCKEFLTGHEEDTEITATYERQHSILDIDLGLSKGGVAGLQKSRSKDDFAQILLSTHTPPFKFIRGDGICNYSMHMNVPSNNSELNQKMAMRMAVVRDYYENVLPAKCRELFEECNHHFNTINVLRNL